MDDNKKIIKGTLTSNAGGGNGTRGTDTNEGTSETKGDKKKVRGSTTNVYIKDNYHSHTPGKIKTKA